MLCDTNRRRSGFQSMARLFPSSPQKGVLGEELESERDGRGDEGKEREISPGMNQKWFRDGEGRKNGTPKNKNRPNYS